MLNFVIGLEQKKALIFKGFLAKNLTKLRNYSQAPFVISKEATYDNGS